MEKKEGKIIRYAGTSGILSLIILLISFFIPNSVSSGWILNSVSILFLLFTLFFLYGFIKLGKEKKFIKITTMLVMIFLILSFLGMYFIFYPATKTIATLTMNQIASLNIDVTNMNLESQQALMQVLSEDSSFRGALRLIFILTVSILIGFVLVYVLFGVGLITLKKIKYSRVAGILTIIGSVLFPLTILGMGLMQNLTYAALGSLLFILGLLGIVTFVASMVIQIIILLREK